MQERADLMPEAHFRSLGDLEYTYWWHQARLAIAIRQLEKRVPPQPRLLDLGAGTGGFLEQLAEKLGAGRAVGVDASASAEAFARKKRIEFVVGDLGRPLEIEAGSFDVVTMMDVLEHLPAERPALETACRNLKPGGIFLCTVPAHPWLFSSWDEAASHFRRYTRPSLRAIFEGLPLRLERCSYAFSYAFPPAVLRRYFGRRYDGDTLVFPPVSPGLNRALLACGRLEARLLTRVGMPVGLSLLARAVRI
jgi:SAM-dependent methyltransferase